MPSDENMDDSQWLVDIPSIEYSEQTSTHVLDGDDSNHIPSIKSYMVVLVSILSYCSDDDVVVVVLHRRATREEIVHCPMAMFDH